MEKKKTKQQNKNKKNKVVRGIALLGLFLMVFGVSYALFSVVLNGTKKNRITTARLSLKLTDEYGNEESEGYGINLESVVPMSDEEGLATESYKFVVENDGTIPASYKLILEDTIENTLSDNYIKYNLVEKMYLKKSDGSSYNGGLYNTEPKKLDTLDNRELHEITILPGQKIEYTLNLWLDENADNGAMDKEFEAKLKIDGVQATSTVKGKAGENIDYTLYNDGTLVYTGSGDMNGFALDEDGNPLEINNNGTATFDIIVKQLKEINIDKTLDTTEEGMNNVYTLLLLSSVISRNEFDNIDYNTFDYEMAKTCYITNQHTGVGPECKEKPYVEIGDILDNAFSNDVEEAKKSLVQLSELPTIKNIIVDEKITSVSTYQFIDAGDYMITLPSTINTLGLASFTEYEGYTIVIPTSLTTIPGGAFTNSSIKEITIPSTVKTVGENAFAELSLLKKVTIEEGVERIESRAFASATWINIERSAKIPNSVKYVGERAFEYWEKNCIIEVDNTENFANTNWDSFWSSSAKVKYLR